MGTPTGIKIRVPANAKINYGYAFDVQVFMQYSSGKEKDISEKSGLSISAPGFENRGNTIEVPLYNSKRWLDIIQVKATYTKKDQTFSDQISVPFNYKGKLELPFNGQNGDEGNEGSDGGTALLFRHGKDGDDGYAGSPGMKGHDLTMHVYRVDSLNIYRIRIMDLETNQTYYYQNRDEGFGIQLISRGGNGGIGGSGGEGGPGKDGVKTEKKTKSPGAGGDGGDGGIGGAGGSGGDLYLFVHENAKEIVSRITFVNLGGYGGEGGAGGNGGKAGTPLEGQDAPANGSPGNVGYTGPNGLPGNPIHVSIENFEIDF